MSLSTNLFTSVSSLLLSSRFDYTATKTNACIIPSCGMDSIPSDLSVYLSFLTLGKVAPDSIIVSHISCDVLHFLT
jgi:short subunit dehydrogenase-like uncharacterized protein